MRGEEIDKKEKCNKNKENLQQEENTKSQITRLIESSKNYVNEVFRDQFDIPYAAIKKSENCLEVVPLKSRKFKSFLAQVMFECEGRVNNEALNSVILVLESDAFNKKFRELHNRVGRQGNSILFDLGDDKWRFIKITSEGWKVKNEPLIFFRRYRHQRPIFNLYISNREYRLDDFINLINVKKEEDKLLLKAYIVSLLIPDIPHPVLIIYGEKGSAKSMAFKLIRSLIDNSATLILSLPNDKSEFVQQLSHNYLAFYDNVGKLSNWQSDILCRAVTGEGFSKRQLYTDDEDVIYSYRRCIGLNGINIPAIQPDLLDRSIIIEFNRIKKSERKKEEEIWELFGNMKGDVFNEILNILAKAMKIKEKIKLENLPRMADFCEWGESISQAMGNSPMKFYYTYMRNIGRQSREAIEGNPLGLAILQAINSQGCLEGTPSEVYEELNEIGENLKLTKERDWPKASNALTRKLNIIKSNLEELGIEVTTGKSGERYIKIRRVLSEPSNCPELKNLNGNQENNIDNIQNNTGKNTVQKKLEGSSKIFGNEQKDNTDSISLILNSYLNPVFKDNQTLDIVTMFFNSYKKDNPNKIGIPTEELEKYFSVYFKESRKLIEILKREGIIYELKKDLWILSEKYNNN